MSPPSTLDESRTFELLRKIKSAGLTEQQLEKLRLVESDTAGRQAAILVVDDSYELRLMMVSTLRHLGYNNLTEAEDGEKALALLRQRPFDLMILDLEMPRLNGQEVLTALKKDPSLQQLPVIVASGLQKLDVVVQCIELGAEDFLPKPVNAVLLRARISASLERARLRDLDRLRLIELHEEKALLEQEQEKSERLLLNILPEPIAQRLKAGEQVIADHYAGVTVLFADLVDFTTLVGDSDPGALVSLLSELFSRFDRIADQYGLEKIKTIGDCYLVVSGLPQATPQHAEAAADMALGMLGAMTELNRERNLDLSLRIGMNSGPVVAGVIGSRKFAYDLWGATVNLASRMQSTGLPNQIHLPATTAELLRGKFRFTPRGTVDCKGLGQVQTCLLTGRVS